MAFLTVQDGNRSTDVQLTSPVIIGRSPQCPLYFPDGLLSRRHLRLEESADGWLAIDLQSTNGTFVSGRRITSHLLSDGDVLLAGSLSFTFSLRHVAPEAGGLQDFDTEVDQTALEEGEISAILNQRDSDSWDAEPEEFSASLATAPQSTALPAKPSPQTAAPLPGGAHRNIDGPSLWDIAMKPPAAADVKGSRVVLSAAGDSASENPGAIRLRFRFDSRISGAIAAIVVGLFAVGWHLSAGFSSTIPLHAESGSSMAKAPAPVHNRNGAFDLPV